MARLASVLALLSLLAACGDDDAPLADAGDDPDAARPDGGEADAGGVCPGQLTFEVGLVDATSGDPPPVLVDVAEVGTDNATPSAPNGRAVLCLDGDAEVSFTADGYLERRHTVDAEVLALQQTAAAPLTVALHTPADADALVAELGLARDVDAALLLVEVRSYPSGATVAGVDVATSIEHGGAFASDADGAFAEGATTGAGGAVLFVNAAAPADADLSITPTGCAAPAAVATTANTVSSTLVACE